MTVLLTTWDSLRDIYLNNREGRFAPFRGMSTRYLPPVNGHLLFLATDGLHKLAGAVPQIAPDRLGQSVGCLTCTYINIYTMPPRATSGEISNRFILITPRAIHEQDIG